MTRLAGCEREATVDLITHLAELDKRRLYLGAGFSSLFTYCTEVLGLSEHAAYHRIVAARTARRFPVLLRMLAQGSLNLTSVRLLASHLTNGNLEELLVVTPLAPDRYQITFTASAETREKLQLAQDLLRHTIPSGDTAGANPTTPTRPICATGRERWRASSEKRRRPTGVAPASRLGPDRVESLPLNPCTSSRTPRRRGRGGLGWRGPAPAAGGCS